VDFELRRTPLFNKKYFNQKEAHVTIEIQDLAIQFSNNP